MEISSLRAYVGLHSSLLSFSTRYVFRISHWTHSPTEFGPFSNLWVVTPEGRRLLFADPPASERVVRIYHKFDEIAGADISVDWPRARRLDLHANADNGTTFEIRLDLQRSLATRFLVALSRAIPIAWLAKDPVAAAVGSLVSLLVAKGSVKVAGHTETGEPFFGGSVEDLLIVRQATAFRNGAPLGSLRPPAHPVAFGDLGTTSEAYLALGRLYLAYQMPNEQPRGA